MSSIYVVDASAWIDLSQNYPKNVFSSLWGNIEQLIKTRRILSTKQVLKEIEQGADDELTKWCKKYGKMFLDNNSEVIRFAVEITRNHPGLVNPYATREVADPFVIALARSLKSNLSDSLPIIVTDENTARVTGIPFVSRSYNLDTLRLIGMFQAETWNF